MNAYCISIIILVILAIALGAFGVYRNCIKESYGMLPPRVQKVESVVDTRYMGDGMYTVPGLYQTRISPRFNAGMDFGTSIRVRPPSSDNSAVPSNPMGYYDNILIETPKIKENFKSDKVNDMIKSQQNYVEAVDMLPASDLSDFGGPQNQPIVWDRYMFANQKSRLAAKGDFIRGDLVFPSPIPSGPANSQVPGTYNWYIPSAHAHIDLNAGALAAMGGIDNSNTNELLALQAASAGTNNYYGSGINYTVPKSSYLGAGQGDVKVVAYN
jgi:hypothetical protein